jgi:glutathione synthase/RimK-type ligase-like ATP-grasp enzyme
MAFMSTPQGRPKSFSMKNYPHVEAVSHILDSKGCAHAIVNTQNLEPEGIRRRYADNLMMTLGAGRIDIGDVQAVWWRLKPTSMPTDSVRDLYDHYFLNREWNHFFDFLFDEREILQINRRGTASYSGNKHVQLCVAMECGFAVPRTLITNDADQVLAFMSEFGGKHYIFKTLNPYMPPTGEITFTSLVDEHTLEMRRAELALAPGIFQEFVEKAFELRVTVVGEEVFAARIKSNFSAECQIDWRRDQLNDIFDCWEAGDDLREKLLNVHRRLGLIFAAYDIVVDKAGNHVFLEANPTGQWLFIENRLGFPIASRIADALATSG